MSLSPARALFEARWSTVIDLLEKHGHVTTAMVADALGMTHRLASIWLHKRDCAGQLDPMRNLHGKRVRGHYVWPRERAA